MAILDTVEVIFKIITGEFTSGMAQMNKAIEEQAKKFETLAATMGTTNESIAKVGIVAKQFGNALTTAFEGPLQAAMDFEEGFARLKRLVDDTSEISKFEGAMKGIISTVPIASKELMHFGEEALKAGANTVESFTDLTKLGAELQANLGVPIGNLLTQMIRFTKIFGESNDMVRDTVNQVTRLANAFTTSEMEILKLAQRMAPLMKTLGYSKSDTLALANAMKELNQASEAGGTAVTQFNGKIEEAMAGSGKLLKAFGDITGQTGEQFAQAFKKDAIGTFVNFIKSLEDSNTSGKSVAAALKELGLEGIRTKIIFGGLAGATDVVTASIEKSREAMDKSKTAAGQANQIWGTTASELKRLQNNANLLAAEMGKGLNKEVGMSANLFTTLTTILHESPLLQTWGVQQLITFTLNLVGIAGALTLLKVGLAALGLTWTGLAATFLVIAPYAAVAAAIILIVTNWDKVVKALNYTGGVFKSFFKDLNDGILTPLGQRFNQLTGQTDGWFSALITDIKASLPFIDLLINKWTELNKQFTDWMHKQGSKMGFMQPGEVDPKAGAKPTATFDTKPWEKPPDEAILEITDELTNSLTALDIKFKHFGTSLEKNKAELAVWEHAYTQFVKVIPLPKNEIEEVSIAMGNLQKKIAAFKEEKKIDNMEESLQTQINKAQIISNFFGKEIEGVRQTIEITRGAIVKAIQIEMEKSGEKNISGTAMSNFLTKMAEDPEIKNLKDTYDERTKLLELLEKAEARQNATLKYNTQLQELNRNASAGVITQLQKETGIKEASISAMQKYTMLAEQDSEQLQEQKAIKADAIVTMQKYVDLQDTTNEAYVKAVQTATDANIAIQKLEENKSEYYLEAEKNAKKAAIAAQALQIMQSGQVALQKLQNKTREEATAIVEGITAAETKYQERLDALAYAKINLGLKEKDYSRLVDETRLQYVKSTETFKEATEIFDSLGSAAVSAFEDILANGKLTAEGLKGVAKTILTTLAKVIAQAIATRIVLAVLGSSGTSQTAVSNVAGGNQASATYTSGASGLLGGRAGGGLVSQTGAYMLHSPEAVVPIEGGSIPVELNGMNEQMQNVTIINVADMSTAQSIAQDKNAIINVISRNIEERGPVYRSIKLAGSKG